MSALLACSTLVALRMSGRRWGVPGAGTVVLTLACSAAAAIGLDAVTSLVSAVQTHSGVLTAAAATFVEEFGEALTALAFLVTVRWQGAHWLPAGQSVRQQ